MTDTNWTPWTEENSAALEKLWAEGLSASQIAGRLGGVTRNAVIGKVHRLGLSGRATTNRTPRQKAARPAQRHVWKNQARAEKRAVFAKLPPMPVLPPPKDRPTPANLFTIVELEDNQCRFFYLDPAKTPRGYCGTKTVSGTSYCAECAALMFTPANPRQRVRQERERVMA